MLPGLFFHAGCCEPAKEKAATPKGAAFSLP